MEDQNVEFSVNFTAVLDSVVGSKIYTDIKAMYDDGRLQKDKHDKIMIAFHEKAMDVAAKMAIDGYRLDDKVDKDIELKDAQIAVEKQRKDLLSQQQRGFFDNRVLEWHKTNMEGISMIQSGGNEAPQNMWDYLASSQSAVSKIAANHPEASIEL